MAEIQNQKNEKPAQPTDAKVAALGQSIDVGIHNLRDSNLFKGTQPFVIDTLRQEKMSEAIASQIALPEQLVGAGISPATVPTLATKLATAMEDSGFDKKVAGALKNALDRRGDSLPLTEDGLKTIAREVAESVINARDEAFSSIAKSAAQEAIKSQKSDTRKRDALETAVDGIWYFLKKFAGENVNAPSATRPSNDRSPSEQPSTPARSEKKESKASDEADKSQVVKKIDDEPKIVMVAEVDQAKPKAKDSSEVVAA
jgi:hypothetical protein